MIAALIRWSVANRFLVLLASAFVAAAGVWAVRTTPLDAIPDLSDTQVIIRTTFAGQAPQIVEDQVTFPLTTTMLSVPGAKAVRGYSFFGDSFVYVIFEDGTDQYWARSRVLEYLNQVQGRLPAAAKPSLGPDATGVGWIYEYALVDRGGGHDLAELRALQDWFLKYELKALPNVAEVATVGGMVRQYQVVVDPARLKAYNLPLAKVIAAIRAANQEAGGSVVELAEAEYMVRTRGYLRSLDDFRSIPVQVGEGGTPVFLRDVARVQHGPEMRRGIAEFDGEGEVVGGIVVLRSGKNAWETIQAVKARLEQLKPGLPAGVEIVPVYDRSALIERAVDHLKGKLAEEFAVVALVCLAFLLALSLCAGGGGVAAAGRARGVRRDARAGRQRQHHVAGRHRDRDRRDGRRGHRDDRERAQEARGVVARARERAVGRGSLARDHRRGRRSRPGALLQPPHHHAVVRARVHARSAGGPDVRAACLHEDLCDGRRRRSRGDAGAGADGLLRARAHSLGRRESAEPDPDRRLPTAVARRARMAEGDARRRRARAGGDGVAGVAAGRRVHAAAGRGRSPVHADRAAGTVGGQGGRAAAADRPPDQDGPGGRGRVRQGRPRRRRPPTPRPWK